MNAIQKIIDDTYYSMSPEELAFEVAKHEFFFWEGPKPHGLMTPIDYWVKANAAPDQSVIVDRPESP